MKDSLKTSYLVDRLLKIQKEMISRGESPEIIKENIIKIFKEEKSVLTNVLQSLLREQVTELQNKIDIFKNKEIISKEEIDIHNKEVSEIQRKINIIYQRSHDHLSKTMTDLNELLEEMDKIFLNSEC